MSEIICINELLDMRLHIPNYQRPYKWTRRNVSDLLGDIDTAINDSRRPDYTNFKYRVGSVILHNHNGKYDIVDGQQRLITLSLIKHALDSQYTNEMLKHVFSDSVSIGNIFDNNCFIREWLSLMSQKQIEDYKNAFADILEGVVLEVDEISEAFQLFDSQNTRGKELDPHDLLKAYHLREMNDYPFEKLNLIKQWEDIPPRLIRELFSLYLFPILNWSQKENSRAFTSQDIDVYKGVDSKCAYTFAQRVRKAMPCFQINEPFCAGSEFFKMVEHYINLIADLKNVISTDTKFEQIKAILTANTKREKDNVTQYYSTGFRYAVNLFYCALLFYYDRFHMLDEMAIKKLFVWAMMIRVDMDNLGMDTINNYAIGNKDKTYTNLIPMFFHMATARSNREIANMKIQIIRNPDKAQSETWSNLYQALKELMGVQNEK
ncbi:MAG: DUF262 domain-containing protein [Muribaculaceae bacterium]|nr:DUF262 domain-containing protein [Muribaculaceae bacterium]